MKEDFHIDTSGRFYEKGDSGIACVGSDTKEHNGCVLSGRIKRSIEKEMFNYSIKEDYAKLYAICIYYLIKDKTHKIERLIVCNDENFKFIKEYLEFLLPELIQIEFINITSFRKIFGKKVESFADNYARCYRKRGLKKHKWHIGKKLEVIPINYNQIKEIWKKLTPLGVPQIVEAVLHTSGHKNL